MTVSEAILTLNANVVIACERAGFSSATVKMIEDALDTIEDAMEAQEPRVMTIREWISASEPADGECMCYEIKDKGLQAMLVKAFDGVRHLYGKAFRVWTSKPSLKQMEETPWP